VEFPDLVPGSFVRRENRFLAAVVVDGRTVGAHVPNSGRLAELLRPEQPVWLALRDSARRKTRYDLLLAADGEILVCVDSRMANALLEEYLDVVIEEDVQIESEVRLGQSRIDFALRKRGGVRWIEAKCCTLVREGTALFPDAPTARGRRHLRELTIARAEGHGAAVYFVVQRSDAVRFAPNAETDPEFALALKGAAEAGVMVKALSCRVTPQRIKPRLL